MTSLRSIIAAFLADLTCAQHRANLLSERLSREYRNHTLLRFFPVPNALLEEAEITLRFAVDTPEIEEDLCPKLTAVSVAPVPKVLVADAAGEIAILLQNVIADKLASSATEPTQLLVQRLQREIRSHRIREALIRNLMPNLESVVLLQSSWPNASAFATQTEQALLEALLGTFGDDEDLTTITGSVSEFANTVLDEPTRQQTCASLERVVASNSAITEAASAFPATRVIVSASDLGSVPDYTVHSLRLKAKLRNYKWVIDREGDPASDQLLPEN